METWLFTWESSTANLNLVRSSDSDVTKRRQFSHLGVQPGKPESSPELWQWRPKTETRLYLEVQPCKPESSPELWQWRHKTETRLYLEVQPCKPESSLELWQWRHKTETWLLTWKSSHANLNRVRSCDSDITKRETRLPGSPALKTLIKSGVVTVTSQNGNLIIYLEVRPCKPESSPKSDNDVTKWKPDYPEVQPCKPESSPELWNWCHKMETSFLALQTWIQTGVVTVTSQNGNLIIYLEVQPGKPESRPELRQWRHKMETDYLPGSPALQTSIQSGVVTVTPQIGNQIIWVSSPANLNPVRSCDSDVTKWKPDYLPGSPTWI
jgi:hypothetical protein